MEVILKKKKAPNKITQEEAFVALFGCFHGVRKMF